MLTLDIQSDIALKRVKDLGISEFKFPNASDKHVIYYKSKDVDTNSRLLVILCDDQEVRTCCIDNY
jgi:hypothetical protein